MARGKALWACGLAMGLGMAGCGGSSAKPPPASCLTVQPCGGDVVGTWSFLGTCSNLAAQTEQLSLDCQGASVNSSAVSLSGLVTFNADMSYTATGWHETFGVNETLPPCATGAATCAALSGTTNLNSTNATGTVRTNCTGASTCSCTIAGSLNLTSETGTYATTMDVLEITADITGSNLSYCVDGDQLHLMQIVTETLVTPQGTTNTTLILSDIVAQRQ